MVKKILRTLSIVTFIIPNMACGQETSSSNNSLSHEETIGNEYAEDLGEEFIADNYAGDNNSTDAIVSEYGFLFYMSQSLDVRKSIQRGFKADGLYASDIDGVWGAGTLQAVRTVFNNLRPLPESAEGIRSNLHAILTLAMQKDPEFQNSFVYTGYSLAESEMESLAYSALRPGAATEAPVESSAMTTKTYSNQEIRNLAEKILDGSSLTDEDASFYSDVRKFREGELESYDLTSQQIDLYNDILRVEDRRIKDKAEREKKVAELAAERKAIEKARSLSESEIMEIKEKCNGYFSIKGICWNQSSSEMETVLNYAGYACRPEKDILFGLPYTSCRNRQTNDDITISVGGELVFSCSVTNTCEFKVEEVARSLVESGKIDELAYEVEENVLGGLDEKYCGRARSGEEVCVGSERIYVAKGTVNKGAPSFD